MKITILGTAAIDTLSLFAIVKIVNKQEYIKEKVLEKELQY